MCVTRRFLKGVRGGVGGSTNSGSVGGSKCTDLDFSFRVRPSP